MLTIVACSFQSTGVIETSLSDFHLITLTVMRKEYRKFQPRRISYRSYKHSQMKNEGKSCWITYRK